MLGGILGTINHACMTSVHTTGCSRENRTKFSALNFATVSYRVVRFSLKCSAETARNELIIKLCYCDKYSLLIDRKYIHVISDVTCA